VDCKGAGIAEGNASISGVASIDAVFTSVLRFQTEADHVSAALDAELAEIRAAFGIPADSKLDVELRARIAANVDGELRVQTDWPICAANVQTSVDANARCEGMVSPGEVMVQCRGRCELAAGTTAQCDANAELTCTSISASSGCGGECKGRCTTLITSAAVCTGTCRGECTGACSAYADSAATSCAGQCDGMCTGTCEVELPYGERCDGVCRGECTVTSAAGACDATATASCQSSAGGSVLCAGRCDGEIEPPMVSLKCDAAVKAEAKMSVLCSAPRVEISYQPRADADPAASAQFAVGVELLRLRLPNLLATAARADLIADAGADLLVDASGAIGAGIKANGDAFAKGDLKAGVGMICATRQASKIPGLINKSAGELQASLTATAGLTGALKL
jgi:hypothetical protein